MADTSFKEELGEHEKRLNEILKSQLQNTNERLDKICNEVLLRWKIDPNVTIFVLIV